MASKFADQGKLSTIFLLSILLATAAFAGSNEGFTASIISPTSIEDPQVGQLISILVEVQNTSQAKGGLITAKYDADLFSFEGILPGTLIPGMFSLPGFPSFGADRQITIQGGGTQMGGTPASGSGLLATMTFRLKSELPAAGASISIIDVQVQASARDTDHISYAAGAFGVKLTRDQPKKLSSAYRVRRHNAALIGFKTQEAGIIAQTLGGQPVDGATAIDVSVGKGRAGKLVAGTEAISWGELKNQRQE